MRQGLRVRRAGTGEPGVVMHVFSDTLVEVAFGSGVVTVGVADLEVLPEGPGEALVGGAIGNVERFGLRLQARYLQHAYRYDELSGLSNARVEPQLHQVFVAHRVMGKLAPRMILADEVGLGKTIEAGLILKELRARQLIDRVLVMCPASLQIQWQHELSSKFNEEFEVLDSDAARHLGKNKANPFAKRSNVICSLNFAVTRDRPDQIVEAGWDLVIFDEAHRVRRQRRGKTREATKTYQLADQLKETAYGFLLLTATPMQLDPYELWSHIELVEPGLYPDFHDYEARRRSLPVLNEAMRRLQTWEALPRTERSGFGSDPAGQLVAQLLEAPPEQLELRLADAELREQLQDRLVDEHPLSRLLVRNRKASIGTFAKRRARRVPVQPTDEEALVDEAVAGYIRETYDRARTLKNNAVGFLMVTYQKMLASSPAAIHASLEKRLAKLRRQANAIEEIKKQSLSKPAIDVLREEPELTDVLDEFVGAVLDVGALHDEIATLDRLVLDLSEVSDSKAEMLVGWIIDILEQDPDEKVLVFTQFKETQYYLADALESLGVAVQTFNGSMKLDDKEAAVRAFRTKDSVLISTEAGGEGRNFQFAHIMFNFDLPWNPMKVEQRIGRLDRIGQQRDVLIYNLYKTGTIEERVLDVLEKRIGLFEESVGTLDPILGDVEAEIEKLVTQGPDDIDAAFKQMERGLEERLAEARSLESTLGDFVMDRASLRVERARELLAEHGPMARSADLFTFVERTVRHWGGTCEPGEEGESVLTIPPLLARKIKSKSETRRGVFDPERAMRLEDRDFFAFGHPLIDNLAQLPSDDDPVVACVQKRDDVPTGSHVELIYEITTAGARTRGTMRRHLVAADGRVRSERLDSLPPIGSAVEGAAVPDWVPAAVAASRAAVNDELSAWRDEVRGDLDDFVRDRLRRAERVHRHSTEILRSRVGELEGQIMSMEAGSEQQRRIIPALRGQIEANEARLRALDDQLELAREDAEVADASSTVQLVAASVVVGE